MDLEVVLGFFIRVVARDADRSLTQPVRAWVKGDLEGCCVLRGNSRQRWQRSDLKIRGVRAGDPDRCAAREQEVRVALVLDRERVSLGAAVNRHAGEVRSVVVGRYGISVRDELILIRAAVDGDVGGGHLDLVDRYR